MDWKMFVSDRDRDFEAADAALVIGHSGDGRLSARYVGFAEEGEDWDYRDSPQALIVMYLAGRIANDPEELVAEANAYITKEQNALHNKN